MAGVLVLWVVLTCVAAVAGVSIGRFMAIRDGRLPRVERKELLARRKFMDDIVNDAYQHNMLGNDFALIVIDEHNKFRADQQRQS